MKKLEDFGLTLKTDIINFSNDGCSNMKKVGKLILPTLQQLCLVHGIQLAIVAVLYDSKDVSEDDEEDTDEDENQDESDESDDEDDDDLDDIGIVDVIDDEGAPLKDENIEELIKKIRKIVNKYCGRSSNNNFLFQNAVKDHQMKKDPTKTPLGSQLARDCKTRWSSMAMMIECIRKAKIPLKRVLKDSTLFLSDEEFDTIDRILDVLLPIKDVVECLSREDADLMTAEIALNELFKTLGEMKDSELAQNMLAELKIRIKARWKPLLAGLLKYLHNPNCFKNPEKDLDAIFKMPSKAKLEELAIDLLVRHYEENVDSVEENEVEIAQPVQEMTFKEKLKAKLSAYSAPSTSKANEITTLQKSIKKEMELFQVTNVRSSNLEKLYTILQNVAPTSVSSERAFSNSSDFVPKKRSCLGDESLDDLCFLKAVFKKNPI